MPRNGSSKKGLESTDLERRSDDAYGSLELRCQYEAAREADNIIFQKGADDVRQENRIFQRGTK